MYTTWSGPDLPCAMNSDLADKLKALFSKANQASAADRAAILQEAFAGDQDLIAQMEKLIDQGDETRSMEFVGLKSHTVAPGTVLGGRFRVVRFVGKGGMGEVYEAEDQDLKGAVAVKIMRPELCDDPDLINRFRREVQIARQVTHANVCRVFDVGYDRQGDRNRVFLTMEFLNGETIYQRLQRTGPLDMDSAMPLIHQMAAGLGALHEHGIVHRDFKPGNVIVVRAMSGSERAVVSDFGLARAFENTGERSVTGGDRVVGTPEYMAPEQLLGEQVTPATDIYAFGLVMYEMATGKRPFAGVTPIENAVKRVVERPVDPRQHCEGISRQWNATILRCLARNPTERPQSVAEVLAGLSGDSLPRARASRRHRWAAAAALAAILAAAIPLALRWNPWQRPIGAHHMALLPLKVLSDDPSVRVFAEGLTETITSRMSQFEGGKAPLLVVPASEVRAQHAASAGDARQKFGVGTAVEGTLESQGDRVRLMLTLVDTKTMRQADTIALDDQRGNSWRLQDAAVNRLANALNLRLLPKYAREQQQMSPIAPGAYEFYLQARGYLQRNDQAQSRKSAIELLRRALDLDPKFALAHSTLGQAYLYAFQEERDPKMMEAALASGNYAVRLNAEAPETNIALGLILHGTGRYDEARQRFEKAIALDGRNHEAYQGLAKAFLGLKDYANAEATYRKAISLRPDDWTGYKALALFYYEREAYAKAAAQFQRVVDLTPDNAPGYLNLGGALAGMEDWNSAEKAWLRALALDPKNQAALSNLGKLYLDERRQTNRAIEMYRRALALNDRGFRTWGQLGRAYRRIGDREKADQAFSKALALIDAELSINPKSVALYSSLGFYRALMGREDFAAPVEHALELAPDNKEPLLRGAEAYAIAGNKHRAAELLDKAVALGVSPKAVMRSEYLKDLRHK